MAVRELSCSLAMAEALKEEMERDKTIFILGEDLVSNGGIFGQFRGLAELFPSGLLIRLFRKPQSSAVVSVLP